MDLVTYALCKKYVNETASAQGAVKGAPCTIVSTQDMGDSQVIVFGWTGDDGTKQTSSVSIPYGMTEDDKAEFEEYINRQLSDVTLLKDINFITDNNGNTLWTGVDSIPVPTPDDAGKVLGVDSSGHYALFKL